MARWGPFFSASSAGAGAVAVAVLLSWISGQLPILVPPASQPTSIPEARAATNHEQTSQAAAVLSTVSTQASGRAYVTSDEVAACSLSGQVADCGCDFASVERMNKDHLHPLLASLVQQPFFRFFKVNIYCDCQFWPDAGMCVRKDCCVAECEESDIPAQWRAHDKALEEARRNGSCDPHGVVSTVDRSVDEGVQGALSSVVGWRGLNNPWLPDDHANTNTNGVEYIYVDLQKNVEKYTGYKGEDARRIWAAIYDQSALREAAQVAAGHASGMQDVPNLAPEQQVLYRLISGMHASITASIVQNFYDEATGTWGPNLDFFKFRFASPSSRPYVENLYFTLLFVLRAVTKAGDALLRLDYDTGWSAEDAARTRELVSGLVHSPALQSACPTPFDEGLLWRHDREHSEEIRKKLQVAFHNITRLMDCVGCEKCKLNGKLNMLGIASALKVLFSQPEHLDATQQDQGVVPAQPLVLERNEAIALVNFLAKLCESVETVRVLSNRIKEEQIREGGQAAAAAAAAA